VYSDCDLGKGRSLPFPQSKDLMAILSNQDDMFPLGRWIARQLVCPPISELDIPDRPGTLHHADGLNSEGHSWLHQLCSILRCLVVVDHRRHVEVGPDAVTTELLVHHEPVTLRVFLDH